MCSRLWCGLVAACVFLSFTYRANTQELNANDLKDILASWADQLKNSKVNPPERGPVPLEAFVSAPNIQLPALTFNRYLSLEVTDITTVSKIKFSDVMKQLAGDSGDKIFTKEMLFHQWWDTQNQKPGLFLGPHCDDTPPQDDAKQFLYDCPRLEGNQATEARVFADEGATPPNDIHAYSAIAISNRFDLLSAGEKADNGKVIFPDCGEYRIVFALNTGKTSAPPDSPDNKLHEGDLFNRNLISFEFRPKNPNPIPENADAAAPQGCIPILKFWYSLSENAAGSARGDLVKDFFFNGVMKSPTGELFGQIPKIVDVRNLEFSSGQIRTNQFVNNVTKRPPTPPHDYTPGTPGSITVMPNDWMLREFRILNVNGRLLIVPVDTKSNPDFSLFKPITPGSTPDPRVVTLIENIKSQSRNLLGGKQFGNTADIDSIRFVLSKSVTNSFQGVEGSPVPCTGPSACVDQKSLDDIARAFTGNTNLSTDIQDYLSAIGAPGTLSAQNIVDRLRTQTCAGCHQFSDTKQGPVGFDDPLGLGGGAHWPTKACGDYGPNCSLSSFVINGPAKLHPPMQFTQVSEAVLVPAAADAGHYRYAISSTVECMLDYREKVMAKILKFQPGNTSHCP